MKILRLIQTAGAIIALSQCGIAAERLNILILYADDLGYGDLTCYNANSKIPTPHLDKLASEGLSFSDGHSSSGICTPSRYALLTGRHHWRDFHGIANSFGESVFKKDQLTIASLLKENGYHTATIGKWHLGRDWDAIRKPGTPKNSLEAGDFDWSKPIPEGPGAKGFEYSFGDDVINFPPYAWIENDRMAAIPDIQMDTRTWRKIKEGNWECRPGPMVTGWDPYEVLPTLTEKGVEFIKSQEKAEKPFFLYFAFPSPHAPIIPNDEFDGKSKAGAYGDFVYETDDSVGRILKALEDSGLSGNTLVIFTADNGSEHYAYERDQMFNHWSSEPFRGVKRDLYEGGHHVPFIVKFPNVTKPGTHTHALTSQVDILATIAEATGCKLPADHGAEDSFSLIPVLKGSDTSGRDSIVHNTYKSEYALRQGDWLLIDAKSGYHNQKPKQAWLKKHNTEDKPAPTYLYNLREDIGQRSNLAATMPEKVTELQGKLKEMREAERSSPRF